jgi:hypothetical protein
MNEVRKLILEGVLEKMAKHGIDKKLAPLIYNLTIIKNETLQEIRDKEII